MIEAVWWLVFSRAILGTLFIVVAAQMVLHARDERAYRRARGENGMQDEILTGQIRYGTMYVVRLLLLGGSAWLSMPFIGHSARIYSWPQVVATSFVLLLTLIDCYTLVLKWRENMRLTAMAKALQAQVKRQ